MTLTKLEKYVYSNGTMSPSHFYFYFGIICGRLWGSLAVEDHLRSILGITCGLGIICDTVQHRRVIYKIYSQIPVRRRFGALNHLYGNFGENFPSNRAVWYLFFGTENRNRIELYHLQNTGKFFAFARHEAWHYNPNKWYRNFGRFDKNVSYKW